MSKQSLINIHMHVFTKDTVPPKFLRVRPIGIVRRFPESSMKFLSSPFMRRLIGGVVKVNSRLNSNNRFFRILSFLDNGLLPSQEAVLNRELEAARKFDPEASTVILTMNMDYMDEELPPSPFLSQIEDIIRIKRHRPSEIFPFLGIDPRDPNIYSGDTWVRNTMQKGIASNGIIYPHFAGLKLYPALGFFPFDKRLEPIYRYAEEFEIPLITHCTRVGSIYIGTRITELIPRKINGLLSPTLPDNPPGNLALSEIQNRIEKYYSESYIAQAKNGANDVACDLFSHPQNYIPLLEQFPKLKLCIAHMGGDTEIVNMDQEDIDKEIHNIDKPFWFDRIKSMMVRYPSLHTDISYTLSALKNDAVLQRILELMETKDNQGEPLSKRVLFGTDFFMTEFENSEEHLFALAKDKLSKYWTDITVTNNHRFLGAWAGQEIPAP
jgi:predicted TIM-barrel fold metal-dependent hydrolase